MDHVARGIEPHAHELSRDTMSWRFCVHSSSVTSPFGNRDL
jgi:hypothetical protein